MTATAPTPDAGRMTLSIREAADRLGVDPKTITRAADRNEIVTVRLGRRRLVPVAEMAKLVGVKT